MDRPHDEQVHDYREELLGAMRRRGGWQDSDQPESFQVFVNQESVGTLDGSRDDTTCIAIRRERAIHSVEIRSESGLLVGGLCAKEFDWKTAQFRIGRSTLTISVHNGPGGGTSRVALHAASPARSRIPDRLAAAIARLGSGLVPVRASLRGAMQAVLVVAVLGLVADRVADRWDGWEMRVSVQSLTQPMEAKLKETREALAYQEQLLRQLAQGQEKAVQTVKAQQETIAGLHRAVEAVAEDQERLGVTVEAVRQAATPSGERAVQAVENRLETAMESFESERERVYDHIFHLTDMQERLTRAQEKLHHEVVSLKKRELRASLEQQAVALAKMMSAQEASKMAGGEPKQAPLSSQAAEGKHEPTAYLVTFWVSFEEGTSEKTIEEFIKGIHGRKGPSNAGWYPVEINLPKPQASDELFESLKKVKIVKAITTSLNLPPSPE